ncbi:uncharacterized protein [Musca autumnalis]|uniref:uncharacterized protein n=1 Tax=Musca autumnalis TaxID=221902 RepID=UPI003CF3FAD9
MGTFKAKQKSKHKEIESSLNKEQAAAAGNGGGGNGEHNNSPLIKSTPLLASPHQPQPPPPLPIRSLQTNNNHQMNATPPNAFPLWQTKERNTPPYLFANDNDDDDEHNKEKSISHNDDPKTNIQDTTETTTPTTTTTSTGNSSQQNTNATTQLDRILPTTATPSEELQTASSSPSSSSSPQMTGKHMPLKRNNSYRLANDNMKLEMNKENQQQQQQQQQMFSTTSALLNTSMRTPSPHHFKSLPRSKNIKNILQNVLDDSQKSIPPLPNTSSTPENNPNSRKIAKSFERLIDEFSLSTISVDSSYLRNKSLENFDDSPSILTDCSIKTESSITVNGNNLVDHDDNDSDSDLDSLISPAIPQVKYHKSFIDAVLMKPLKIILPHDDNRRQRILQKFEVTEIW